MRTLVTALASVLAVYLGIALCRLEAPRVVVVTVLAGLTCALGILWIKYLRAPPDPERRRAWALLGVVSVTVGLLRGLSADAAPPRRNLERDGAASAQAGVLQIFEVVGASEPGARCRVELRDPDASWLARESLTVKVDPDTCPLSQGDRVALNPRRLAGRWTDTLGRSGRSTVDLGPGPTLWLRPTADRVDLADRYWRAVADLRQRAWETTRGRDPESLVVAVGLGLRAALPPALRAEMRAAGLGHLIAVSGLHVAVAGLWLQAFGRRVSALFGGSPQIVTVLTWAPLLAYVGLTGAPASAVRAALMLMALDLGAVVGRPTHGPTLLAITAVAMLWVRPAWALDPGFQLSLAAMGAIVTAPPEQGPVAMSWRISWATAPLSALHFGAAPMHSLIANAVALPLFALLMPTALLGSLSLSWLGVRALAPASLFAAPILALARALAQLPAAGPLALAGLALLGLGGHAWHRRRRSPEVRGLPIYDSKLGPDLGPDRRPPPAWLPPRACCVLTLAICTLLSWRDSRLTQPAPVAAPTTEWISAGTLASRTLLVLDSQSPGRACLYRPLFSTRTWTTLLEQVDVRRLHLEARLSAPPGRGPARRYAQPDPRILEFAAALRDAGFEVQHGAAAPPGCAPPSPTEVREALRACRFRQGGDPRTPALAALRGGELRCRFEDRWVAP